MKLPKSITVGHLRVAVRNMTRKRADGMSAHAVFDDDDIAIEVQEDLHKAVKAEKFVHELLHAMLFVTDHNLNGDAEERVVTSLAPVLTQVIRDNFEAFKAVRDAVK